MGKIEKAITWMENTAADPSAGYDQAYRWGEYGDYDCSSAVITAWEKAGVPVKSKGGATYTGNMKKAFLANGFVDVTSQIKLSNGSGLKRGDVLLNEACHTAMYCGNGKEVEASINEFGCVSGGSPGDQTGKEFAVNNYRNYPWDCVLRYAKDEENTTAAGKKEATTTGTRLNTTARFYAKVQTFSATDETLSVRSYAGITYPKIKSTPELQQGDVVKVCDTINDDNGAPWYYVKLNGGIYGFIYAEYADKVNVG